MSTDLALWLAIGAGVLAILYGVFSVRWILAQPAGSERMQEIAAPSRPAPAAYLNRQYTTIAIVGVVLAVILGRRARRADRRRASSSAPSSRAPPATSA